MSFAEESGYIPSTIPALMAVVRENINTQFGTSYTAETFLGTNFYKYFYAMIQRLQENEVKTSEIFLRMQEYFDITNEEIQRPKTTHPGIFDVFEAAGYLVSTKPPIDADAGKLYICVDVTDNHARGEIVVTSYANLVDGTDDTITVGATAFTAQVGSATLGTATFQAATSNAATATSLAAQINAHATAGALVLARVLDDGVTVEIRALTGGTGGNAIALAYAQLGAGTGATVSGATLTGGAALIDDEDDYDDVRLEICEMIKDCVVGGVITQGPEVEAITLSNGQEFNFKYTLPDRIPVLLKLTITQSENNLFTVGDPDDSKATLLAAITEKYKLGKNFEPQRYFSIVDAPWAAEILLEYSIDNGGNWDTEVFESEFDELFTFDLADIEIVEE